LIVLGKENYSASKKAGVQKAHQPRKTLPYQCFSVILKSPARG
jgi:hypothetical protein